MINKFTSRILVALCSAFLVFGLLSALLIIQSAKSHEQKVTQRIHSELAQHVVDHYLLYKNGKPDYEEAKKTFHDLMILGANFEFYLLNKHGEIVSHDAKPDSIKLERIDLAPVKAFIEQKDTRIILGEDPKHTNVQKVFSVAPIYQMGEVYGYLYVIIGSQTQDVLQSEVWYEQVIQSSVGMLVIFLIVTLASLILLVAFISRPLVKLSNQVKKIRKVGFNKENHESNATLLDELRAWPADSSNDIHLLGHAFYEALQSLQEQYNNVVSIDDLRKELLSHVSHDLRTPLASLLGYLETWEMQRDTLDEETSREYIATAKQGAQKIATLIEQLFELAHLDGDSVTVRKEPIAIAELVQDVLQKFVIPAEKKHIQLDVQPQDGSIIVHADIEKLERVFTNLIENALRHTPDGGSIVVNVKKDSGFVSIQVSDNGIGIPEQDLPYIFDPHFKAGNSVRENTAHGGLGLAITKKLLELHEVKIRVASQLNKGTTFSFSLPPA